MTNLQNAKIITVSGGKGGIGKTFFSVNLAAELVSRGYRVLIFDGDVNLSNVNIMTHINADVKFSDFFRDGRSIETIVQKGVGGIDVIYSGENLMDVFQTTGGDAQKMLGSLHLLEKQYDFIIVDTSAGIDDFTMNLILRADFCILITNSIITSLTDLYRLIKVASHRSKDMLFDIVINQTEGAEESAKTYRKISETVAKFRLPVVLNYLGFILQDQTRVNHSIMKRIPAVILYENEPIRNCFALIADQFLKRVMKPRASGFFSDLMSSLGARK